MLAKYVTAGLAGSLMLASAAFAAEDNATTTASPPAAAMQSSASSTSFHGDWRASKVVGLNVYNEKNENVGSINDLLMDKSGGIKAAVISVGGFLGMGARLVAVPFDKIKFSSEPVAYTGMAGAPNAGGARPPEYDRWLDRAAIGEGQSLVSGSRHDQRHRGRAEGDAGVQIRVTA